MKGCWIEGWWRREDCQDAEAVGEEEGFFKGKLKMFLIWDVESPKHEVRKSKRHKL